MTPPESQHAQDHAEHRRDHHAPATQDHQEFWEGHYGQADRIWSGRVNARLVEVLGDLADLPPGRALDLGCGEGGDAVWLAQQGWQVTGVDISGVALARARAAAEQAGVADRVTLEQHDLTQTFPEGAYDLVSAQFLQSPVDFDREALLRQAARSVAPGGVVVVVEHGKMPPWSQHPEPEGGMPTAEQTLAALELDPGAWEVVRADSPSREMTGPDGQPGTLLDNVVVARRR